MIALFYFAFPVGSGLGYTSGFQMVATFWQKFFRADFKKIRLLRTVVQIQVSS